jgi:hypothetical protein
MAWNAPGVVGKSVDAIEPVRTAEPSSVTTIWGPQNPEVLSLTGLKAGAVEQAGAGSIQLGDKDIAVRSTLPGLNY